MNTQPVEKDVAQPYLDVVDVFETIQGEGPFFGTPSVFIRLAGCTLQCPQCDTQYTVGRCPISAEDLAQKAYTIRHQPGTIIVLTGGEPLRQRLGRLLHELRKLDCYDAVQIETNGVSFHGLDVCQNSGVADLWEGFLHVVCSPKTPKLDPLLMKRIDTLKYVVQEGHIDDEDGLPTTTLGQTCGVAKLWGRFLQHPERVFISPLDEGNEVRNALNRQAAVVSCLRFGYRLSLQQHKLLGLP